MSKLFISHSSQDDAFVRDLRAALADHGQDGWIDSRELRGGDPLWTEIQQAIEDASAYAVVVSPDALQSKWVGKELRHALEVQKQRGKDKFPVIPLSLNGTKLGVLEEFFGEEPVYIPVSSDAGGVEAAMNAILVALGKRLPADVAPTPQPKAEPLEELVLELTDLKFHEQDGVRRASARARLVYEPATPGQPRSRTARRAGASSRPSAPSRRRSCAGIWRSTPSGRATYFRDRARKVEENLVKWGRLLHEAAMPVGPHGERHERLGEDRRSRRAPLLRPRGRRARSRRARGRRRRPPGKPPRSCSACRGSCSTTATATCSRARSPRASAAACRTREVLDVPVVATPIRILLVTARPEDDACGYIDHRASALPLVEAMEALRGLVKHPRAQPAHAAGLARGTRPRPRRPRAVSRRPLRRPRRL